MTTWPTRPPATDAEFERLLLASACDDDAPMAARARVAAGLGLEPERLQVASRSPQPSLGSAPSDGARARLKSGLDALLEYTLIGLAGGSVMLGTGANAPAVNAPVTVEVARVEVARVENSRVEVAPIDGFEPRAERGSLAARDTRAARKVLTTARKAATPSAGTPARRARAGADPVAKASDASADELLAEVKQLDRVRAELETAESQSALRELDAYDAKFPRGTLAVEALVLRARALQGAGQFAVAARIARRALTLPGSERYRSELGRLVAAE